LTYEGLFNIINQVEVICMKIETKLLESKTLI